MNQKTPTGKPSDLRISPAGMVQLTAPLRQKLGFQPRKGRAVSVKVEGGRVLLAPAAGKGGVRVSPRGLLQLPPDAHAALAGGRKGACQWETGNAGVVLAPRKG